MECSRPTVCSSNLWKLRAMFGGSVAATGGLGVVALPLIGFGAGGVAAGSAAAAWQSSIGSVTAGSLFAILQTLGATGLGSLLFGGTGTALGLLGTLAVKLDWCDERKTSMKIKKIKESCKDGCTTTYQLIVSHIENLQSHQSQELHQPQEFKLRDITWKLGLFKYDSEYLGLDLVGNKSCKIKMVIRILSRNECVEPFRKEKLQDIEVFSGLRMNHLILWNELRRAENEFITNTSVAIEVEITDGIFFGDFCEVDEEKPRIESLLSATDTVKQSVFGKLAAKFGKSGDTELTLKTTKMKKTCKDGCLTSLELTVANIDKLTDYVDLSQKIKIRDKNWEVGVGRYRGDDICLDLVPNKSCNVRMVIQIRSESKHVNSVRKVIFRNVNANRQLRIDKLISWKKLLKPENGFIMNSAFKIEVEMTDGIYLQDSRVVNEIEDLPELQPPMSPMVVLPSPPEPEQLAAVEPEEDSFPKCGFCSKDFVDQSLSSVPCGHIFCSECIEQAVRAFGMCPTCKKPATSEELSRA